MSKKYKKKLDKDFYQVAMLQMIKNYQGFNNNGKPSDEADEALKEDKYREEAYAKIREWVIPFLEENVRSMSEEFEKIYKKDKVMLKKYEKELAKAKQERLQLHLENEYLKKKVDKHERELKEIKKIMRIFWSLEGVCNSQASLKSIRKKIAKKADDNTFSRNKVIDASWKEV